MDGFVPLFSVNLGNEMINSSWEGWKGILIASKLGINILEMEGVGTTRLLNVSTDRLCSGSPSRRAGWGGGGTSLGTGCISAGKRCKMPALREALGYHLL